QSSATTSASEDPPVTRWIARALVVTAVLGFLPAFTAAPAQSLTVSEAIALYAQGNHTGAIRDVNTQRVTVTVFTNALDTWIASGDAATLSRRKLVAAAFALDAVWSATRTPWNNEHANYDIWERSTPREPERVSVERCLAQALVAQWVV